MRSMIDVIVRETLLNKMEDEACNLIKETMLNNLIWCCALTFLTAKMNVMA